MHTNYTKSDAAVPELIFFLLAEHRRRSRGGGQRGQLPPLADKGQTVIKSPPFRRLSGMMPGSTDKTGIYR